MKTNLRSLGAALTILACTPSAASVHGAQAAHEGWTPLRMDVELSFLRAEAFLLAEGELTLENLTSESLDRIELAVRTEFTQELALFGDRVAAVGDPERIFDSSMARVRVDLDPAIAPGAECVLAFAYAGAIEDNQIAVAHDFVYSSWVEGWYPYPLQLDGSRPERTPTVAGRTTLHLPPGWHGVTNGSLEERSADDEGVTEIWSSEVAVARSFAAGRYTVEEYTSGERSIAVYLLAPKPTSAKDQAQILGRALVAMERRYGPYPYASYRIAEAPMRLGGWGASSEQGFILAKANFFEVEGGNLPLFAHEAAHGWWGNLVGQKGAGSILCSESLAQYGAVLAIEELEGPEAATEFLRFSRAGYVSIQCARGYFTMMRAGNDMPLSRLGGGGWQHNLSDAKGHWFYHMLRRRVGDEVFFATLRELLETYAGRSLSLDDLRAAFLRNAAEDADLERFLAQWLDREGAPHLELDWTYDEASEEIELELRQVQAGEPYALRVDVALVDADGTERLVEVRVEERVTRASFSGAPPKDVLLDPRHALLIWKPEYE